MSRQRADHATVAFMIFTTTTTRANANANARQKRNQTYFQQFLSVEYLGEYTTQRLTLNFDAANDRRSNLQAFV